MGNLAKVEFVGNYRLIWKKKKELKNWHCRPSGLLGQAPPVQVACEDLLLGSKMFPNRWPTQADMRILEALAALTKISLPNWFWIPNSFLVANPMHFGIGNICSPI